MTLTKKPTVMAKDILISLLHRIATGETIERSFDYFGDFAADLTLFPLVATVEPIKCVATAVSNLDLICKVALRDRVIITRTFIVNTIHRTTINLTANGEKGTCNMTVRNSHEWENPQFIHVAGAVRMLSNMVRNEPYMVVELEVASRTHRIIRHVEKAGLPFSMSWNAPAHFPNVTDEDASVCEQIWNAIQTHGDNTVTITTPTVIITFDYSTNGDSYYLYVEAK